MREMKGHFMALMIGLAPLYSLAEATDSTGRFGVTINSSLNSELYRMRLVPSLTYIKGKNQLELGVGMHPVFNYDQQLISAEFNHKYFPNGTDNKLNMYLISRVTYVNNQRETYYPSTYNYIFTNAGYGFEINAFAGFYMGTNVTAGAFTYSKRSSVPHKAFQRKDLFEDFSFNMAYQFHIAYRF